jgi:hypothetical protein
MNIRVHRSQKTTGAAAGMQLGLNPELRVPVVSCEVPSTPRRSDCRFSPTLHSVKSTFGTVFAALCAPVPVVAKGERLAAIDDWMLHPDADRHQFFEHFVNNTCSAF